MNDDATTKQLSLAMLLVGTLLSVGLMVTVWWFKGLVAFHPSPSEYEEMLFVMWVALGIYLIKGAFEPLKNSALVWFTVMMCAVQGAVYTFVANKTGDAVAGLWMGAIPALFGSCALLLITGLRARFE